MLEIIVYICQLILTFISFLIAGMLLKKNKKYIANRLMAGTFISLGLYAFLIFLYKVLNSPILLQINIRISFIALVFSVIFLFATIQILVYSSKILRKSNISLIFLIIAGIGLIVCMIGFDWLQIEGNDIMTLDYTDWLFYYFAGYIGLTLISSKILLYKQGIRKTSGEIRKHLVYFLIGLIFMLIGLITEGLGGVFSGHAELFDILLFLSLLIGVIFMAHAFIHRNYQENS